nr:SMP-30/gluconolactonase/LRE family protein [uncultured Moellerella sp.]
MNKVQCELNIASTLGESPIYSRYSNHLIWVDAFQQKVHFYHLISHQHQYIVLDDVIGFICETQQGKLIVGLGTKLIELSADGQSTLLSRLSFNDENKRENYRFNDGKIDSEGRIWIGVITNNIAENSGFLYCFDQYNQWHQMDDNYTLINGLDWHNDNQYLYVTDSRKGLIYQYNYDHNSGKISHKKVFFQQSITLSTPDGLIVTADGSLLSVIFDGAMIIKLSPAGELLQKIPLPVPRATSCVYCELTNKLYITSATIGLSDEMIKKYPFSGGLLSLKY